MSRFNKISYNQNANQLTVGAGCVFDEIYKVIRASKYNIVGGGGSVGVGGWIMGGGYSLKTNQYGLGIDNLVQVEIVLPNGSVEIASARNNVDLFWAIRVCPGLNLRVHIEQLMPYELRVAGIILV